MLLPPGVLEGTIIQENKYQDTKNIYKVSPLLFWQYVLLNN